MGTQFSRLPPPLAAGAASGGRRQAVEPVNAPGASGSAADPAGLVARALAILAQETGGRQVPSPERDRSPGRPR